MGLFNVCMAILIGLIEIGLDNTSGPTSKKLLKAFKIALIFTAIGSNITLVIINKGQYF